MEQEAAAETQLDLPSQESDRWDRRLDETGESASIDALVARLEARGLRLGLLLLSLLLLTLSLLSSR